MTLNEKTGVILKQHKEGEEFFNEDGRKGVEYSGD